MEEDKKAEREEVEDGSEITLNNSLTNENLLGIVKIKTIIIKCHYGFCGYLLNLLL